MIMDYNKAKATWFFVVWVVGRINSGRSVGEIIMIMLSFRAGEKSVLLFWFTENEGRSGLYNKELSCLRLMGNIFCLSWKKYLFYNKNDKFLQHRLKTWNPRKSISDSLVTRKLIPKGTLELLYTNIAQLMILTKLVYVAAYLGIMLPTLLHIAERD